MKKILLPLVAVILSASAFAQTKKAQPAKAPATKSVAPVSSIFKTLRDSTSYSLGVNIARNLKAQNLDNIDAMLLYRGLSDVLLGKKVSLSDADASRCVNTYVQGMNSKKATGAKLAGQKFLAENAKKPGIISMPGGWQYEVLKPSESKEHPTATDKVKCHYHGTLIDGTVFDSSVDRGEPMTFGLNQVIKGWTIAVQQMTVGSKWRIFLPSDLAYGDNGAGEKIVGGSALIFEIELLGIEK
jgi:FKBP-type peptidyl-prolyl cis-trans isomerase FklB